jgi:hypothetical protein
MKYKYALCGTIVLLLLLGGCGPSAEQIATMTASAWTPTPLPTAIPTPTPLPYDLTVTVIDETGAPIAGASIVFPESGDGNPIQANDQGQYSWTNLGGEAVSLTVSAQGYINAEQTATIQRGPNEVKVTLKRDPFGLLPSTACAPDQKVLYIEDFQDGQVQGWPTITASLNGVMPFGWSIVDENGNKILLETKSSSGGDEMDGFTADNFVWHAKFKAIGNDAGLFFMWRITHSDPNRFRYVAVFGVENKPWMIRFMDSPTGPMPMNTAGAISRMKENQWYDIAIAYFNGVHQVWYDGKKQMEYKDTQPFPPGTIGFETHLDDTKASQFYIDDLVICELTAPYQPSP